MPTPDHNALPPLPGLFVTGTDTGVGKTWVAAAIAHCLSQAGRRVGVLKPVATGAARQGNDLRSDDAELLIEAIGSVVAHDRVAPLVFEEPLAPPVAARLHGTPLGHAEVLRALGEALAWWAERAEVMVVEGVGGLLCPLAEGKTVADLAIALDYPLVIVARSGLGTLNHMLLTVEAARLRGLRIAGIILNAVGPAADLLVEETNREELARRLDRIALLASLVQVPDPWALSIVLQSVDWYGWARPPRVGVQQSPG